MQRNNKFKLFFILLLFLFISVSFVWAQRELEVPIPGLPTTLPVLPDYIKAIFNLSLVIAGLIAFFVFIYGGFRYLTSAGSAAKMADAKDQIVSGILGLIIIFSSYLILTTINPQLVILHLPGIEQPILPTFSISSFEKRPTTYQTIPVGTIIEGKVLNENKCKIDNQEHCQKLLDKAQCQTEEIEKCKNITCEDPEDCKLLKKVSDLDNILYVVEKTKGYAKELKDLSEELRNLINQCECGILDKGSCESVSCDDSGHACDNNCSADINEDGPYCPGEPCPNRDEINEKREDLRLFTGAFESFLDKTTYKDKTYETVGSFINDYETDIMIFPNSIYGMEYIENKNGGFKEIIENFENQSQKTLIAEKLMKECRGQPITYNNMLTLEDIFKEEGKEIIKENFCNNPGFKIEMDCEEEKSILPFADSATFYCFLK